MANRVGCDYGTRGAFTEQVKDFVWHSGQQAAVTMVVNALFMFLLGEEDVVPGLINGGVTALSINTVHKLSHMVEKETSDETAKGKFVRLALLAVVNYFAVSYISKELGYKLTTRNILEQTAFSYVGILSMSYYLKVQAERARRG